MTYDNSCTACVFYIFVQFCIIFIYTCASRYAAPIYVDIEYVTESNGKKSTASKVSLFSHGNIIISYGYKFSYHVKFVFSEWCNHWENAYNVKKLLLSLIWEGWRRTGKTWLVDWEFCCMLYINLFLLIPWTEGSHLKIIRNLRVICYDFITW